MTPIILRRAGPADSDALWALRTASISAIESEFYDEAGLTAWAQRPQFPGFKEVIAENFYIVAIHEHQIVGGGFLDLTQRSIEAMFVRPDLKRMGIGKKILTSLISEALRLGWNEISLSSTINAVPFYQALGFKHLGRSQYQWSDGLELECELMKLSIIIK